MFDEDGEISKRVIYNVLEWKWRNDFKISFYVLWEEVFEFKDNEWVVKVIILWKVKDCVDKLKKDEIRLFVELNKE